MKILHNKSIIISALIIIFASKRVTPSSSLDIGWIETGPTGNWGTDNGEWSPPQNCPSASFVTGYDLTADEKSGEITSMSFQCAFQSLHDSSVNFTKNKIIKIGLTGSEERSNGKNNQLLTDMPMATTATTYAVGFAMQKWTESDNNSYVGGRVLRFKGQEIESIFPRATHKIKIEQILCPTSWGVCGVQGKILVKDNYRIVTQLRLKCCYFCIPRAFEVTVTEFENRGSGQVSFQWRKIVGSRLWTNDEWTTPQNPNLGSQSLTSSDQRVTLRLGWPSSSSSMLLGSNLNSTNFGIMAKTMLAQSPNKVDCSSSTPTCELGAFRFSVNVVDSMTKVSLTTEDQNNEEAGSPKLDDGRDCHDNASFSETPFLEEEDYQSIRVNWGTETRFKDSCGRAWMRELEKSVLDHTRLTNDPPNNVKEWGRATGESCCFSTEEIWAVEKAVMQRVHELLSHFAPHSTKFAWVTPSSMLEKETHQLETVVCDPMTRCIISQTMGTCGAVELRSENFDQKMIKIKIEDQPPPPRVSSEMGGRPDNEIWILAKNISFLEPKKGDAGGMDWVNLKLCPANTIVTGHQFKLAHRLALTGLALRCSNTMDIDNPHDSNQDNHTITLIKSPDSRPGRWYPILGMDNSPQNYAWGFRFIRFEKNAQRWLGNWEFLYKNNLQKIHNRFLAGGPNYQMTNNDSSPFTVVQVECPVDHGMCGMDSMMDQMDKGVLTALAFKCCHICTPHSLLVTRGFEENRGTQNVTHAIKMIFGAHKHSPQAGGAKSIESLVRQIRTRFPIYFPTNSSSFSKTTFDWSNGNEGMWREPSIKNYEFTCLPKSACKMKQLIGICGQVEIATPHIITETISLVGPLEHHDVTPRPPKKNLTSQSTASKNIVPWQSALLYGTIVALAELGKYFNMLTRHKSIVPSPL